MNVTLYIICKYLSHIPHADILKIFHIYYIFALKTGYKITIYFQYQQFI